VDAAGTNDNDPLPDRGVPSGVRTASHTLLGGLTWADVGSPQCPQHLWRWRDFSSRWPV